MAGSPAHSIDAHEDGAQVPARRVAWEMAERQHGVVAHAQLSSLGCTRHAIDHLLERGLLTPLHWGVYMVAGQKADRRSRWFAAVLACGPAAALSHLDAGELYGIHTSHEAVIHVSVAKPCSRRHPGVIAHRRSDLDRWLTEQNGVPVTDPALTLVDLAAILPRKALEAAVNAADARRLIDPESLRSAVDEHRGRPGVARLRRLLDRQTFRLTDSELERRFLPLVAEAGLPVPQTGAQLNGWRVDFFWPELGLVVETDGLRYHRTPAQQARDRLRDQAHLAAGLTPLRFTHEQIAYRSGYVRALLVTVVRRLHPHPRSSEHSDRR